MILKRQQGQGLIEIIIVVLIISISTLSLLRFQSGLAYADTLSQQQNEAAILAESKIESLRDFQVLNVQSPYTAYQSIASGSSTSVGTNASYTLSWTVTSYTNPTYKMIDVSVTWNDIRNTSRTVRLISNVAGIEPAFSATIMY